MNEASDTTLATPSVPSWAVWRQDDLGNRFLVRGRIVSRPEAEQLVEHFTAKGHKQLDWVEQDQRA